MQTLAVIAHDGKKADLVAWATFNRETLARFRLVATRHTARLMQDKVGLVVERLLSGPEGGDVPLATNVATADLLMTALADDRSRAAWALPD